MYVVSEITGKKYATVEQCKQDEHEFIAKKEAEQKKKATEKQRVDAAWVEVTKAIENYVKVIDEVDASLSTELKPFVELMRML